MSVGVAGVGGDPPPPTFADSDPAAVRALIRAQRLVDATAGMCMDYQQANLVVVPDRYADDFGAFCRSNPRPCPLLERTRPGSPYLTHVARNADVRTDVPRYRVFERGVLVDTPFDVRSWWRDDAVAFLLGCSLGFEQRLLDEQVPVRHIEHGTRLPMYRTAIDCVPAGPFTGPLVVSLRPIPEPLVQRAVELTERTPWCHGGPVHIGDGAAIGIADLDTPDFGDPPVLLPGDVPVFWACGVTPQVALEAARPPWAIAHYPGHMLITDLPAGANPSGSAA